MSAEDYGLERGAQAVLGQHASLTYNSRAGEMAIALSTAISLKRIADALEAPRVPKAIDLSKMSEADQQSYREMIAAIAAAQGRKG